MGGPQGWGACPLSLWPPRGSSNFISKSPGCLLVQENQREGFIPFGLRLVFLFCGTQKQGKTRTSTGL
mgnify:CR=1 FL=1